MKRLLTTLLALLMLTGCGYTVQRWELDAAEQFCSSRNGTDYIQVSVGLLSEVRCNNGEKAYIATPKGPR